MIIYLAILCISGFFTFIAIRWRTFLNRQKETMKRKVTSTETKSLLKESSDVK